jgi:hypothetical protein
MMQSQLSDLFHQLQHGKIIHNPVTARHEIPAATSSRPCNDAPELGGRGAGVGKAVGGGGGGRGEGGVATASGLGGGGNTGVGGARNGGVGGDDGGGGGGVATETESFMPPKQCPGALQRK